MALGCVGVDLVEGWKARAVHIVRNSPDPARSLQLLRDKAAAMFGFGDMRPVTKRQRRSPVPASPTPEVPDAQVVGQEERIEDKRPWCLGPAVPEDRLEPRRDGGLFPGAVLAVRAAAVQVKEDDRFEVGLQLNSMQKDKIKKCHKSMGSGRRGGREDVALPVEDKIVEEGFQLNSFQEIKMKKCITKRVKMKMCSFVVMLAIHILDAGILKMQKTWVTVYVEQDPNKKQNTKEGQQNLSVFVGSKRGVDMMDIEVQNETEFFKKTKNIECQMIAHEEGLSEQLHENQ